MAKSRNRKTKIKKVVVAKRKRKVKSDAGSNLSSAQLQDFVRRAVDAKHEVDRCKDRTKIANKALSVILKDARSAGIHPDNIKWYLAAMERSPAEIDAETRERNTIARAMKLPLGTQLGLFDDGATVASRIVQDGGHERDDLKRVAADGEAAGKAGKNRTDNPWPLKSPAFDSWDGGWIKGQTAIASELGTGHSNGAELR